MNKTDPRNAVPAYHNKVFLDSDDGRSIRILCEYIESYYRLRKEGVHDTIFFLGHREY